MPLDRGRETHNVIRDSVVFGSVLQARDIGGASPAWDGWAARVFGSNLWEHVGPEADFYRSRVCAAASHLEGVVTALLPRLVDDPWLEPAFATRFLERIEWLWGEDGPELCASEAALLMLLPFLRQATLVRLAAEHAGVNPAQLGRDAKGARSFAAFLDAHDVLVHRAQLRPESAPAIGWWLFHRWLARHESFVDAGPVLRDAGTPLAELGETFAVERVSALLEGMRLGPDVCHPEFLGALPSEDHVRAPGRQRIRDQRLALTTTLAATLAIEATALPDVVGEHLGIPVPVDPPTVVSCLDEAVWGGPHDLPVLRAACPHEAVVEGLREHTANADELLHGVRRAVRERITHPMPQLPTRLSAAGVGPASGTFDGWARFRLDQHRMRDLLMGVQLYKDPDLAVRELYQNALDACRYRAARTEYLDRTQPATYSYSGRISFVQGFEDGRAYLECRDDGIGMGESELRGVFSNAGARFPGQAEFRHERTAWEELDPPIPFYPNSRFGIGVFSYFMLADEIRVTTCRMGLDGTPGALLEVGIHGPAHLFRIVRVAERGEEPGTRVRLYLRDAPGDDRPWSCVEVLRRMLAVAEFETTAQCDEKSFTWRPGKFEPESRRTAERFGFDASGKIVEWRGAPEGCQVFWCEKGGALLVDGLIVLPSRRRGVCAGHGATVHGVVVNLFGALAPTRMSVDRTELVDDVSEAVGELLVAAATELAASDGALPDYAWISRVAAQSPIIADIITEARIRAGWHLSIGGRRIDFPRAGFLSADTALFANALGMDLRRERNQLGGGAPEGDTPDHVLLWRLLAHRPNATVDELAGFCPELATFPDPRPAMPSDQLLFADGSIGSPGTSRWRNNDSIDRIVRDLASILGMTTREAENKIAGFRSVLEPKLIPVREFDSDFIFPDSIGEEEAEWLETELLDEGFYPPGPVPVWYILELAKNSDLSINAVVDRLRRSGYDVDFRVPETLSELERRLLRPAADWWSLDTGETMPLGYLVVAAHYLHASLPELAGLVRSYGVEISRAGLPQNLTFETALELMRSDSDEAYLQRNTPSLHLLVDGARHYGTSVAQIADWYRELGIHVPDLGDTLRAALARVPRARR